MCVHVRTCVYVLCVFFYVSVYLCMHECGVCVCVYMSVVCLCVGVCVCVCT